MTSRLPGVRKLADDLRGQQTRAGKTVDEAAAFLRDRRAQLQRFATTEDLGVAAYDDPPDRDARALVVHLEEIRNALIDELWARQIFIGPEVMDDLLFGAVADQATLDPVLAVLEYLRDRRANRPGMVLFGLHTFGILGAGLVRGGRRVDFVHSGWGMAISAQTNNLVKSVNFFERARESFGVRKPVPVELIAHWRRSRAPWLERNPLLAMRIVSQRGSYFDAEWPITTRLRATTALTAMIAVFQPPPTDHFAALMTSSHTNNWETLDIHHYLVLYDNPGQSGELHGDAVPIHARGAALAELSELNVQLDPSWRARRRRVLVEIEQAIGAALSGYLRHRSGRSGETAKARTYNRAFESLDYFRRSFARGGATWAATVSLATAFEMLLTDHYASGVDETLAQRTSLLLSGVRGRVGYQQAVRDVYQARSNIVHAGSGATVRDLTEAQRAYALAFAKLVPRIAKLSHRSMVPIAELTGDG
jgi:hypothetical protein